MEYEFIWFISSDLKSEIINKKLNEKARKGWTVKAFGSDCDQEGIGLYALLERKRIPDDSPIPQPPPFLP